MQPGRTYVVDAHALNIRTEAKVADGNRIALLPQGHTVIFVAPTNKPDWWEVRTTVDGMDVVGFVAHEFLADPSTINSAEVPAVHLTTSKYVVSRSNKRWAYALNEPTPPRRTVGGGNDAGELGAIIDWLDVEKKAHARYQPKKETYCNIYAYDYCCLAGAYLPRVWWYAKAIADLAKGKNVEARYDKTVGEQNANMLFDWLREWGDDFGWARESSLTAAQQAANDGRVVIMSGKRTNPNAAGHITAIVPETDSHKAKRDGSGAVTIPLQSQAGRHNHAYHTNDWGMGDKWADRGVWVHD